MLPVEERFVKASAEVRVELTLICSISPKRSDRAMVEGAFAWYWVT